MIDREFESFVALGRVGVLPPEFAACIAACAGLRNRIVHLYDAIDAVRVHEALQSALRDVPEYLKRVSAHIAV